MKKWTFHSTWKSSCFYAWDCRFLIAKPFLLLLE